jgi:uncharacterized protein HemX
MAITDLPEVFMKIHPKIGLSSVLLALALALSQTSCGGSKDHKSHKEQGKEIGEKLDQAEKEAQEKSLEMQEKAKEKARQAEAKAKEEVRQAQAKAEEAKKAAKEKAHELIDKT